MIKGLKYSLNKEFLIHEILVMYILKKLAFLFYFKMVNFRNQIYVSLTSA